MTVPLDPHAMSCSSAIDDPHLLGDVARLAPVFARLQLADLPGAVHLVAQAPVAHVVRLLVAVRAAQVAPLRAAIEVAVLDVGDRHLRRAGAEVHAEQRLGPDRAAPVDELVGAELIRLQRIPRPLEHRRPLRLRTDAVEPVVAGDEVAAGIADDRNAQLLHLARDVRAESLGVGQTRAGLVDARVDGAAEVLQERAQHPPVEVGAAGHPADERARGRSSAGCPAAPTSTGACLDSFLEHLGRAVYTGVYAPGSRHADAKGFRTDVAREVKELGVPIVRYPAGISSPATTGSTAVGPKAQRPTVLERAWNSIESNQSAPMSSSSGGMVGAEPLLGMDFGTGLGRDGGRLRRVTATSNAAPAGAS